MALTHGSSVVTNRLVFYYDMNNVKKSWVGPPATNLITYSQDYSGGNFMSNWTGNMFNNWINSTVTPGQPDPIGGYTADLLTGYYARYSQSISVTAGQTYTFSCWLKNAALTQPIQLGIATGNSGTVVSAPATTNTIPIASVGAWTRYSVTYTIPASGVNQIQCGVDFGSAKSSNATGYSVYAWGAQCEVGSYATPYMPSLGSSGSRSTTQAIVDLLSSSTITANSLTYSSSGSFSFNGSSNYITASSNSGWAFGGSGTVEQWVYISGNSGTNNRLWCVSNNSSGLDAYLNGGSYNLYFHGGAVGTTTTLPTGVWVNVAVTYVGGTISVYFNGVSQGLTGTTTGYNITNNGTLYVGEYSGGGNYYINGQIASTKIYNKGLSATEVAQNFNAQRKIYGV